MKEDCIHFKKFWTSRATHNLLYTSVYFCIFLYVFISFCTWLIMVSVIRLAWKKNKCAYFPEPPRVYLLPWAVLFYAESKVTAVAKLTDKQRRFCDEYLVDANATAAAIRAGYSKRTAASIGAENLIKPDIKNYIARRMAEKEAELIADQDEVLQYLTSVMRGQSRSSVVVVENVGDYMSEAREMEKGPDEKERLKAAELLGRRHNLFSEKVKVDVNLPVVISGADDLED